MGQGIRPKGAGSAYCKGCKKRFTDDALKPFKEAYCVDCKRKLEASWKKITEVSQ